MAASSSHFYSRIESVRASIHQHIESAVLSLRDKENELNAELDRFATEYASQLSDTNSTNEDLINNPNELSIQLVNTQGETELTTISFLLNQEVYNSLQSIGDITISTTVLTEYALSKPVTPDYKAKIQPIKSCCKKNDTNKPVLGEFKSPWSIAIEPNTGNIYISDRSHYCIQVFDSEAKLLYKFSQEMGGPVGMCFSRKRVLVSQWGKNYITAHSLNGDLLKRVGKKGIGELQFNSPWGIAASDCEVYICERENNRVQILTDNLDFKYILGEGVLQDPRDIKLTQNEIFILDANEPCLHVFTLSGYELVRSFISLGSQISNPYFFDLDPGYNLVISDAGNHKIFIFSNTGVLLHTIGGLLGDALENVMGVAVDKMGRVLCVSGCPKGMLNIF